METNRRNFLQTFGVGAAGLGLSTGISLAATRPAAEWLQEDEQQLYIGDDIAIANTEYGKVRGFKLNGIFQYRGIPYGSDTSGANRFMPPKKPEPWKQIKPAIWWGNTAPQIMDNRYANPYSSFVDHWNYDDLSEDCLKLNVWTPALADDKKRPVLVWFHGGGYRNGNAIEQDGYMGENFSRKGDIVFVSINHRLGPIGFTDLSSVEGDKYKNSGNVGALDMVASLEWVNKNISYFGGDPGNVTIMGQSGGGAKVCTLAAMPKAKGLLHKVVPLSGSTTQALEEDYSQKLGQYVLKEAGLQASEVDKLQEIPWKAYIMLANSAAEKLNKEYEGGAGFRGGFRPVADGTNIPKETFYSNTDDLSSDVPMLICSTFHEWAISRANPELENISADEAKAMLKERIGFRAGLGEKAPKVYDAYAKTFPNATPIELIILIASNRQGVTKTANAKSQQNAPVYVAWFGWQPPLFNNRLRAFHCSDICFWFYNTDLMLTHTGGGSRPRKLADKMSDALLQFMRSGNPNSEGLPSWPAYTEEKGEVMILDDVSMTRNDPDREARKALSL